METGCILVQQADVYFDIYYFTNTDVIPSGIHATHNIESAPSSNSFDALFDNYMSSLSQTLKASESTLSHLTGTFMDGFSASIEWLTSTSSEATSTWSKQASSFKSAAFNKLEEELRSAEALLSKLQTQDDVAPTHDLSMQPLRFTGLQEVESTYGVQSAEYAKAKELVRAAVAKVTDIFQTRSEEQGRPASIAFVVTSDDDAGLVKRSATFDLLAPSPSLVAHQPSLTVPSSAPTTPSPPRNLPIRRKSNPPPYPRTSSEPVSPQHPLSRRQPTIAQATVKAVQSSKGGKPCYRCQCKPTEVRKGKKVYWAGAACEKKDVSTEFVLIASSVILLVLISAGSVYFLVAQGSEELPGTLASVTISLK